METYIVRINGNEYEVEIERKDGASSAPAAAPAPAAKPVRSKNCSVRRTGANSPARRKSGMTPGKVWKIVTSEGDQVSTGDTILILEAMKMEIPVVAPVDGTVSQIIVSEGDGTEAGQTVAYVS